MMGMGAPERREQLVTGGLPHLLSIFCKHKKTPENKRSQASRFLNVLSLFGKDGAAEEIRTPDPRITNALLYQLSYSGTGRR